MKLLSTISKEPKMEDPQQDRSAVSPSKGNSKIVVRSVRRVFLDAPVPVYDVTNLLGLETFCLHNRVVVHNTARLARFPDFQETLPLKGKVKNCLVGSTTVRMHDGTTMRLDQLTEAPWSGVGSNEDDLVTETRMSPSFITKKVSDTVTIHFNDGHQVEVTPDHRFLTSRGYIQAKDLTEEDDIASV